jgi:hypothetical protein
MVRKASDGTLLRDRPGLPRRIARWALLGAVTFLVFAAVLSVAVLLTTP